MIHLFDGMNVMRRRLERFSNSPPMTLRMLYEAQKPGHIWAWDGYRHNERRQAIYPNYKAGRPKAAEDVYAQVRLFRDVLKHSPAIQFDVEGWEADDIISTLTRKYVRRGVPVTIHSNDMDYGQLAHLPGVTLNGVDMKGVPGRWVPLYKAMRGDTSDKIDGIPGFGPGRWLEMEPHWPAIEQAIRIGTPAAFDGLPFKPGVRAWLTSQENVDLLRAMLTITHFEDVPDDELEGGMIEGVHNRVMAHQILSEYFL